jgi:hypothetical protein
MRLFLKRSCPPAPSANRASTTRRTDTEGQPRFSIATNTGEGSSTRRGRCRCVVTRKTRRHKITNTVAVSQRISPACRSGSVWKSGMSPLTVRSINGRQSKGTLTFIHTQSGNRQETNHGHSKKPAEETWMRSTRNGAKTTASEWRMQSVYGEMCTGERTGLHYGRSKGLYPKRRPDTSPLR